MQRKTILVYSNCKKSTAKGDFTFGGNIAVDLKRAAISQFEDVDIILVSTKDGIERFEMLYGKPNSSGFVTISGFEIGISALEDIPSSGKNIAAYIDANYCKPASTDIIKRVINPDSKLLIIGNANQLDWLTVSNRAFVKSVVDKRQPRLLDLFNDADVYIASAGVDGKRIGIPTIAKLTDLSPMTTKEQDQIPKDPYGFMYLSNDYGSRKLIQQYMELTPKPVYVLVGKFTQMDLVQIKLACSKVNIQASQHPKAPQIIHHGSLPNNVMRNMTANAKGDLILSTGVNSALEAMQDGKLTYYQYSDENEDFVTSFLNATRELARQQQNVSLSNKVITLATLLFAQKPLAKTQELQAKLLLVDSDTCNTMIATSKEIIATANGKIAHTLFGVINANSKCVLAKQAQAACMLMRAHSDTSIPSIDKALRRAAATSKIFELKVLIKFIKSNPKAGITINDTCTTKKRSALHWAVINKDKDATRLLVQAGADTKAKDNESKIPYDYALESKRFELAVLVKPSLSIPTKTLQQTLWKRGLPKEKIQSELSSASTTRVKPNPYTTKPNM